MQFGAFAEALRIGTRRLTPQLTLPLAGLLQEVAPGDQSIMRTVELGDRYDLVPRLIEHLQAVVESGSGESDTTVFVALNAISGTSGSPQLATTFLATRTTPLATVAETSGPMGWRWLTSETCAARCVSMSAAPLVHRSGHNATTSANATWSTCTP